MKLYATVASERASKGQGGNQFLDFKIQAGDERAEILRLLVNTTPLDKSKMTARIVSVSGEMWALNALQSAVQSAIAVELVRLRKGEKQKGEQCQKTGCIYTIPCILGH